MKINRGDIWLVNLDPVIGSEISKTRPALVISHSSYNQIAETITVIPISTGKYIKSFHAYLKKLKNESHAVIPQLPCRLKKTPHQKNRQSLRRRVKRNQRKINPLSRPQIKPPNSKTTPTVETMGMLKLANGFSMKTRFESQR